jgi:hypothetical protein
MAKRTLYWEYDVPLKVGMSLSVLASARKIFDLVAATKNNPTLSRASYSWNKYPAFVTTDGQQFSGFIKSYHRRFGQDSDSCTRPACFLSDNGRCMLPRFRHKTSTAEDSRKHTGFGMKGGLTPGNRGLFSYYFF